MRKITAMMFGLLLVAGLVSGCGGDSDKDAGGTGNTTAPTQPDDSGNGGGSNDFSEIVARAKTANIRIVYERDGEDSITIAQDGTGKSAFTDGDSTIYTDGKTTVSCDGTGADAKCTQIPLGGVAASVLTGFTQVFTGLVNLDSSVFGGDVSSDTIAGRDARCITFSASSFAPLAALAGSLDGEATICVDEETGFLLKLESKDGSSTKEVFIATEVGEATEDDVTPPVTPSTIPDISLPDIPGISIPG